MSEKATPATVYVKAEGRILLDHLAQLETRKVSDELTVIIREACERRSVDIKAVLAAAGHNGVAKSVPQ